VVHTLDFEPGDLVLFRGRDAIHQVTPTEGDTTRLLVVFTYNDRPGVALSESALTTFYGRTAWEESPWTRWSSSGTRCMPILNWRKQNSRPRWCSVRMRHRS
jgi:hypothetical protein